MDFINAMQHFAPNDEAKDEERTTRAFVAVFLAKCLRVGGFFDGGASGNEETEEEVLVVGALEHLGCDALNIAHVFGLP